MDQDLFSSIGGGAGEASSPSTTLSPTSMSTEVVIEVIDHMTDQQVITLTVFYIISATLSILGSSTIIYKVLKNLSFFTTTSTKQVVKPYDRLMLGLSTCDVIASISWILTPFLPPEETSIRITSQGNPNSCTFLGSLTQFGFITIWYNFILSFYYLLTIRFQVKKSIFATKYEPIMHIFGFLYFAITSILGGIYGVYSEVDIGLGCWVNDYPYGCNSIDPSSCLSIPIGWAFGAGPLLVTLLTLIINNLIIYFHVKKNLSSIDTPGTTTSGSMMINDNESINNSSFRSNVSSSTSMESIERQHQHTRHIKEVATQGTLYVVTFFIAYFPSQILRAVEAYSSLPVKEQPLFPLLLINSILLPLQGLLNMFVYNRPNYTRLKLAYPELTTIQTIKMAIFDSNIPKLTEASIMYSQRIKSNNSRNASKLSGGRSGGDDGGSGSLNNGIPLSPRNSSRFRGSCSSGGGQAFHSDLDIVLEEENENGNEDEENSERSQNNEIYLKEYQKQYNNHRLSTQQQQQHYDTELADYGDDDDDDYDTETNNDDNDDHDDELMIIMESPRKRLIQQQWNRNKKKNNQQQKQKQQQQQQQQNNYTKDTEGGYDNEGHHVHRYDDDNDCSCSSKEEKEERIPTINPLKQRSLPSAPVLLDDEDEDDDDDDHHHHQRQRQQYPTTASASTATNSTTDDNYVDDDDFDDFDLEKEYSKVLKIEQQQQQDRQQRIKSALSGKTTITGDISTNTTTNPNENNGNIGINFSCSNSRRKSDYYDGGNVVGLGDDDDRITTTPSSSIRRSCLRISFDGKLH